MHIRRATADEIPALTSLVRDYWSFERLDDFDEGDVARVLAVYFATPHLGRAWIAEADGNAVGYLIACFVFSLEHKGVVAEIDEFFLRPAWRSHGLGERMLALAEQEFEASGCTNVSLEIGVGNDAARGFYSRRGFDLRGHFQLMSKPLGPGREGGGGR